MVIAGGGDDAALDVLDDLASTEPAMVIAGGPPRPRGPRGDATRFNGAGDGDRRRASPAKTVAKGYAGASTEPAMVIAGGGRLDCEPSVLSDASTEPAMVIAGGALLGQVAEQDRRRLQRSRRW